jgi:hypothetical protein
VRCGALASATLASASMEAAMSAAHFDGQQAAFGEARQMRAGGRGRQARDDRQFAGRARAAVHQRPQHGGPAGVGEQRADPAQAGEVVVCVGKRGGHMELPCKAVAARASARHGVHCIAPLHSMFQVSVNCRMQPRPPRGKAG